MNNNKLDILLLREDNWNCDEGLHTDLNLWVKWGYLRQV